jgi:hypothetical protein
MNKKIALNVMEIAFSNMSEQGIVRGIMYFSSIRRALENAEFDDILDALESLMQESSTFDILSFQEVLWFTKVLNEFKLNDYTMLERYVLHQYDPSISNTYEVSTGQSVQRITNEIFNSISHH